MVRAAFWLLKGKPQGLKPAIIADSYIAALKALRHPKSKIEAAQIKGSTTSKIKARSHPE
jgi:hypothetical protein